MRIKKHHFESSESYLHNQAKKILKEWLNSVYLRVDEEVQFVIRGKISFIADLVCYDEFGISVLIEISHTHDVDARKLSRIQMYKYINNIEFEVYEIKALTVMEKTRPCKLNNIYKINLN